MHWTAQAFQSILQLLVKAFTQGAEVWYAGEQFGQAFIFTRVTLGLGSTWG
jgi:hypothetical protein